MNEQQSTAMDWHFLPRIDKACFGCGPENGHGLQMHFESNGVMLRSTVTVSPRFRGWSNLVHGGVLSTILDETMGWTAIHLTSSFVLTKDMQVAFTKPVRVGATVTAFGWIKEQASHRQAIVGAEIRDESDMVCASAEGTFALFTKSQFRRLNILPEEELEAMMAAMS